MKKPEALLSQLLSQAGFRHAFFTRRGGASAGPYASLNFSASVGDDACLVAENQRRAAALLGVEAERLCFASQVHGSRVLDLNEHSTLESTFRQEADAVASRHPELACAVRTADCVPVLLAERRCGWVAAVHAGWRGVVRQVVPIAVRHLQQQLDGRAELLAAIGPHISLPAFEVSDEVAEQLAQASNAHDVIVRSFGPKPHVNLRAIVRAQLLEAGLAEAQIDDVGGCTVQDTERFFSFRRDGRQSGRLLSAIVAARPAT